jgi:hypothetical protein
MVNWELDWNQVQFSELEPELEPESKSKFLIFWKTTPKTRNKNLSCEESQTGTKNPCYLFIYLFSLELEPQRFFIKKRSQELPNTGTYTTTTYNPIGVKKHKNHSTMEINRLPSSSFFVLCEICFWSTPFSAADNKHFIKHFNKHLASTSKKNYYYFF